VPFFKYTEGNVLQLYSDVTTNQRFIVTNLTYTNELPRSRAARYQKEFSFNPDAEHRGNLLIINTPVPEPATMLLLGVGLMALAGLGRKKLLKKKK
jgi:hypothetical protein